MSSDIAVITIPLTEWNEIKNNITTINKNLIELKGIGKPEFLTPKEVCELLKCSRNTFQSYIEKGYLEPVRINTKKYSKLLVKRSDVDYFLLSRSENKN
ncbi:helix-turn-helix domain-containing protein [Flavobacterium davisii]|uniref:Helix-turn-helix domain-containing protein n=1 Tax=Flavobacterium columnare TaxID=996 RepID=A0A8G0KUJ5_9FLAO|nr:helix-turn-helix domain-containing protein [Flavobacterium davisii]QYS88024.1 helix-turn-helix domain-containing protein [Flavobacterium davisii]